VRAKFAGFALLSVLGGTALGTAAQMALPEAAHADMTFTVQGTWKLHPQANTIGDAGLVSNGPVSLHCQKVGQQVTVSGYGTSSIWDYVTGRGYMSDLGIRETLYAQPDPRLPNCDQSSSRSFGRTEASNSAPWGQCTWGAKEKFHQATGVYPALYGNAKDWSASAGNAGWTVVADAEARSIVVFQPGVQGADRTNGHVAWVDSVEFRADGRYVHITEMNAVGFGQWSNRVLKDVAGMSYILAP
jgi:surface antigen